MGAGDTVTADDLVVRRVRFGETAGLDRYFGADADLPPGLRSPAASERASCCPRTAVGPAGDDGLVQLPVAVDAELVPPAVAAGSVVDLYVLPSGGGRCPAGCAPVLRGVTVVSASSARRGLRCVGPAPARARRRRRRGRRLLRGLRRHRRAHRAPWSAGAEGRRRGRRADPRLGGGLGVRCPRPARARTRESSCSAAASTSPTCSRPPRPARPTWPWSLSRRPASTSLRSTTCVASRSARSRSCRPAPPTSTGCEPPGSASR